MQLPGLQLFKKTKGETKYRICINLIWSLLIGYSSLDPQIHYWGR